MKRRYGIAAALCLLAMAGTFVPNLMPAQGATPAPLSPGDQAFENQLSTYLQNLQGALTAASQNAVTQPASESSPSVKFTAFEAPTMTNIAIGM